MLWGSVVLEGSWVDLSGVTSLLICVIIIVTLLITPLKGCHKGSIIGFPSKGAIRVKGFRVSGGLAGLGL